MHKKILFAILSFLFVIQVQGQHKGIKGYMEKREQKKDSAIAEGRPFLSIIAGPGYTPENGLLVGAGMIYTFKTNRKDSLIQRSSIPFMGFISTKGNFGFNSNLRTFWLHDKLRANILAKFSVANDNYFGVGFSNIKQLEEGDSTTAFKRQKFIIKPLIMYQPIKHLYVGGGFDFNSTKVLETNPVMDEDAYYNQFGPDNFNVGLTFTLNYDSRDIIVNPYKGYFFNFAAGFYGDYLGGDNDYNIYELDFRTYQQIHRPGNTIALKLYGRFGSGDIPYEELTKLGGGDGLRGYIEGHYRDRTGLYFLAEWRHMFLKNDGNMSKHGVVTWLGSGTIAYNPNSIEEWIPNFGIGYRFEVQPRMNVRIDFGIGRESSGLYFNFTEAF
ncbi:BamA/TamA family outer membrane protein [Mangrovimonas sp. DI 80]|uniref:BamA/TamA family outer membrane protein n=1 Tax=Mangrovimonas sp. DI 80 TaxID=1779330 RepID=UPI000976442D|nr:BamA/TamA family outer membrane protein [Mangrovimonas sp. DI 80]OMP31677.1 hypothetical protein BKM32_01000 [Mangrovimonas sp. DI 80]